MLWPTKVHEAFVKIYLEELKNECSVFNSRPKFRPYLDYRHWVKTLKLKRKQHDNKHFSYFRAKGREIQRLWAQDIVEFIVSELRTPVEQPWQNGAEKTTSLGVPSSFEPIHKQRSNGWARAQACVSNFSQRTPMCLDPGVSDAP